MRYVTWLGQVRVSKSVYNDINFSGIISIFLSCIQPTEELPKSAEIEEFIPSSEEVVTYISEESMPNFERFVLQGSPFVRLAGLSGAAAVALGAYGAHCKYKDLNT